MTNPWLFVAMVPAMIIIMLHLAIGPFGHPSMLSWHLRWKRQPRVLQLSLVFLAVLTLLLGSAHLLGWWAV